MGTSSKPHADFLQPFLIDHSAIQGRLVRLETVADTILTRHRYPQSVAKLLAEMLVVASMLSSNLKTGGMLTLQAKGDGRVKFLVVDATHDGGLRGYAEIDDSGREALRRMSRRKRPPTLHDLLGKGYLCLTFDTGVKNTRYQGIVELADTHFTDAILSYFTQSHQVEMALKLAASKTRSGWKAGGILIERLPEESQTSKEKKRKSSEQFITSDALPEALKEQWLRNRLFLETAKESELLSRKLSSWALLQRLFGEEGVWAYSEHPLAARCRCSRKKILDVLHTLPEPEINHLLEDGVIRVHCRFCNRTERILPKDLARRKQT